MELDRAAAIHMRLTGSTWRAVADKYYYGNVGNCHSDIREEVKRIQEEIREDAKEQVHAILARLDAAATQLMAIAEGDHPLIDNAGRVVRDGVSFREREEIEELIERNGGEVTPEITKILMGKIVLDRATNVLARKELRQQDDFRANLLGLKQPAKTTVEQHVTYEVVGIDPSALD